jgi:inorganic pyrophosphatase
MTYDHLPIGDGMPERFFCVVEIPKDTKNKYEYDEQLDVIRLDRVVHSSVFYPVNYGFIPETRAEDGDHLDVLILGNDQIFPGCVVEVRPVGVMKMTDDKGVDWKIVSVIVKDPKSDSIREIGDIDDAFKREVQHFFEVYKQLEGKTVTVEGWGTRTEAEEEIRRTHDVYTAEHHRA